jgi:hypothetical protein
MALNPKYDPMDFPVYRQRQAELQAEKALRLAKGDTVRILLQQDNTSILITIVLL